MEREPLRIKPLALALWLAYSGAALAQVAPGTLPASPTAVNGTVNIANPTATSLQVTNTPGAIIHWDSFSIGSSARVTFDQTGGAASAVLNRVTGGDPSQIYGRLDSNGRIFLINPNGILFGAGSAVDAQGLVASTRDIANADFLSGNYLFRGTSPGQVLVENTAQVTTAARGPNGQVWLVGAKVTVQPGATISAPDGQVVLAAGSQLQVGSGSLGNMVFTVTTDSESTIDSFGTLAADRGGVGLFADSIAHRGTISSGGGGEVQLVAARDITVADGGVIDASGAGSGAGGRIRLDAGNRLAIGTFATVAADGGPQGGNGGQVDLVGYDVQVSPVLGGIGNVHASARAPGAQHGDVRVMLRSTPLDSQPVGNEVGVTINSGLDMYPDVMHLADGTAIVTWMSNPAGTGWNVAYATVYLQRLGANGQPIGDRVQVGTTTGNQSFPSVTPMRDGGFLVAWSDGRTGRREVWARSFGADGVPRAPEMRLSTDVGNQDNVKLATLADGRMLLTWSSRTSTSPLVVDLRGQLLDANGSATGTAFTINATGTLDKGSQYRPEIAPLADGGFVVTYHAIVPGTYISQADAFGRRYDRNGVPVGPEFLVAATAKDDWRIVTKSLVDGGFVVVWDMVDPASSVGANRLMGRRFDARGVAMGSDFAIGYVPAGWGQSFAQLAPMADGGFAVTWMSYQNGTSNADVYAQRFAANGQPVAAPRLVAGGVSHQSTPHIAATADNGYTVTWYTNQNGTMDIYAQRHAGPAQQAAVGNSASGEMRGGAYATAPGVANGQVSAPLLTLPTPAPEPTPDPTPTPTPEQPPVTLTGKTESALNAVRQVTPTGRPDFVFPGKSPVFTDRVVVTAVRNAAGEIVGYEVSQNAKAKSK